MLEMTSESKDREGETEAELLDWLSQSGVNGQWIPHQYDPLDDLDDEDLRVFSVPGGNSPRWSIELSFAPGQRVGLGITFEGFGDVYLWAFEPMPVPFRSLKKILETVLKGQSAVSYNRIWGSDFGSRYLELPDEALAFMKSSYSRYKLLRLRSHHRRSFLVKRIPLAPESEP